MLKILLRHKLLTAFGFGALIMALLTWESTRGGVVTHHLLAREDLPGISNWWGLLTVPLLAFVTLLVVERRLRIEPQQRAQTVFMAFFGALLFGLAMGALWQSDLQEVLSLAIWSPLVLAFFLPVYRPEYLLGLVVGLAYTFGGVLPFLIGFVLVALSWVLYQGVQLVRRMVSRSA